MKLLKTLFLTVFITASSLAFAGIYMGAGAEPTWTPLYPENAAIPPTDVWAPGIIPSGISTYPLATRSVPIPFTAPPISPSASSYTSTNYAHTAPTTGQVWSAANAAEPCQQVDMVYGKGPLVPTPCPTAAGVLEGRPVNYHVQPGSLKANVQSMVEQSRWGELVWNVPNDYRWVGDITITATSIQDALAQLLGPYPVQAVFYSTNRVVDIEPRREQ
jgi:hypothetical protein